MRVAVCILLLASAAPAVTVDRVAVSLGNRVITSSEILERIALTAFQNNATPAADTAAWKTAAEQLIDQKLVQREMQVGRYSTLDNQESEALLDEYRKQHFESEAKMREALQRNGLTLDQLRLDLARQADLLNFLNLRFRPAVQVTDEDVRSYYKEHFATKNISLDDARLTIEETLTNERADRELDAWLKDQRKRVKIEDHSDAFPPAKPVSQ